MQVDGAAQRDSEAAAGAEGWWASLSLGFRRYPARTVLAERRHRGPLAVQRTLYPEGEVCHACLLHPPGGVAGGDTLEIGARVEPGAAALVTTPGATKFYRSAGRPARQRQRLRVNGGSLEWLPQENILFPGANAALETTVELTGGARFIGWEIHCLGRPANGERFLPGRALFRFGLLRDGLPLLHDHLQVAGEGDLKAAAGLRGKPVFATLCATPVAAAAMEGLRRQANTLEGPGLGVTRADGLFIARYLGDSPARARHCFTRLWERLRPAVLDRVPCPPRIWNT